VHVQAPSTASQWPPFSHRQRSRHPLPADDDRSSTLSVRENSPYLPSGQVRSHLTPVTPGGQTHWPERASHVPPFSHVHSSVQLAPYRSDGQAVSQL